MLYVSVHVFLLIEQVLGRGYGAPRGCTLIFSYIRRLGPFYYYYFFFFLGGGVKTLNFIFLGFQKNAYFWGMKILWIYFWGRHKIGLYLWVFFFMHFRVFSQGQGTEWGIFLVAKISNIFEVLETPYIFGVNGRCWAPAYVLRKHEISPGTVPYSRTHHSQR